MQRWSAAVLLVLVAGCSKTVVEPAAAPSTSSAVVAAERLQACESAHGLTGRVDSREGVNDAGLDERTLRSCDWPPRAGEDADGFESITATIRPGPGQDEASDTTEIDEISGSCATYRLQFRAAIQGNNQTLPAFTAAPGDVVDSDGRPFTGWLGFYPSAALVEVVHNDHVVLSAAACA